jgi:uridine kinase
MAGGTASGKTTIAACLAERLPGVLQIGHDRYYRSVSHPEGHDFDAPAALESDLLAWHLQQLQLGRPVKLPVYDYARHQRLAFGERVLPQPVIVVDGILVLAEARLVELFHLKVWVEAPADLRLIRRIRRDALERGRSLESVLLQYEGTVRPSHLGYVEPQRALADLVLDGEAPVEGQVERLIAAIGRIRDARSA